MDVRTVPRTVVERSLALARMPVDVVSSRMAEDAPVRVVVDRVDANVRDLVGRLIRDPALQEDAASLRAAADEHERAARLRAEAALTRARADEEVRTRTSAAQKRQEEAEQKAVDRVNKAEEERKREEETVEQKAEAKKKAARQSAA